MSNTIIIVNNIMLIVLFCAFVLWLVDKVISDNKVEIGWDKDNLWDRSMIKIKYITRDAE